MNVQKAAEKSLRLLLQYTSEVAQRDEENPCTFHHAVWMLTGIVEGYVQHEKAHRWLGWAQAVMFTASEDINLGEIKDINKRS